MKKIAIFLLLALPFVSPGQDYRAICPPGTTYFRTADGNILAFRRDSAIVAAPGDTLFVSYPAVRDTLESACKDTTCGSILGKHVYGRNDGMFFFFNRFHDTLKLRTQAALNESWDLFSLNGGNYIFAKVTAIQADTVLGVPDTVKVISILAKDQFGQEIPSLINGTEIRLSKHFGLTMMFDTYWFPQNMVFYQLCGMTGTGAGIEDMSWRDVYDYDPEDEFHFYREEQAPLGPLKVSLIIKRVLDKQVFGDNDSVLYHLEVCSHETISIQGGVEVINAIDTVAAMINFLALDSDLLIRVLPQEFTHISFYTPYPLVQFGRNTSGFNGRLSQEMHGGDGYTNDPPCYGPPFAFEEITNFTDGLGVTFYYHNIIFQFIGYEMEEMKFYKKGSEVWGTPVSTDCNTLVPADQLTDIQPFSVIVLPNPASDRIVVRILALRSTQGLVFQLYDFFGRRVREMSCTIGEFSLSLAGMAPGIYLYSVSDQDGNHRMGKIILSR